MRMSRLRTWATVLLVVLAIGMTPWLRMAMAITPKSQTVHIIDTHDDGFITEVGIGIDSALVHILDPGMDLRAFLVFREIKIDFWEPLKNATLRLRTSNIMAFDANSSVTIHGISLDNLQLEGWLGPAFIMSAPLTGAYVNVNTSDFYGQAWHEINVTNIVEELIRHYNWDGAGVGGTEPGDAIGFIILGAEDETRYFYDYRGNPSLSADLVIHWNHEPTPPSGPGTSTFNETYRGYHIFVVDHISTNRTGEGFDVNWNLLNVTKLTKSDVTGAINVQNDTWVDCNGLKKSAISSLYNDTGDASINSFFIRFKVNVTDVNNVEASDDVIPGYCSVSSLSPTTDVGLLSGDSGDWAGLASYVDVDDQRFRFWMRERKDTDPWLGTESKSQWFNESEGDMIYVEFIVNVSGDTDWMSYELFDDPGFTNSIYYYLRLMEKATGPFRYAQTVAGIGFAGNSYNTFDFYTYDEMPVEENTTWSIVDENGTTVVIGLGDYDDALIWIDDILGADPQDPDPPADDWPDEGPFTRFSTRMYIFIVGFFMVWGTVWFFAWKRPDGYYLLVGALFIIMGIGLIIHSVSI